MNASIEFNIGIKEIDLPVIKLTKSKNGQTGTATFIFINPMLFQSIVSENYSFKEITGIYLKWDNKSIFSDDLEIIFKNGKPFLLKSIFILKNYEEWFNFLNFMVSYSKETGLYFSEKNS